ncbi:hypothetical protein, partial [Calditerricola satsumensis]|uniref:hypothetical protein n=1 Tax=Calditerricola satsumensis TaxID=373054 RepID=UPI001E6054F6
MFPSLSLPVSEDRRKHIKKTKVTPVGNRGTFVFPSDLLKSPLVILRNAGGKVNAVCTSVLVIAVV